MEPAAPPLAFYGLDPRALLLAAFGSAVCFSVIQTLPVAIACLVLSMLLAVVARVSPGLLLRRLAVANLFILFLWATVPLTVPGENVASLGPFGVSREGIALALSVTVKCNAILLCFLVLIADLSIDRIGYALARLRVPDKLVFLFLFTCRYIHVIGEEWQRLQTSARLRGFVPRTSMHTYRTIGNMLGLTIVNSMDRARNIHEAMLLRGFAGTFHTLAPMRGARRDILFTGLFFGVLSCLLAADVCVRLSHA